VVAHPTASAPTLCSVFSVANSFQFSSSGDFRAASWQNQTRFFPLPTAEGERLRKCLVMASEFSALDPCVGDGVAFASLFKNTNARRYGIEIDANRAEQARILGIETLHANTMDVGCPAEQGPVFI
jgi:hypothetical protein